MEPYSSSFVTSNGCAFITSRYQRHECPSDTDLSKDFLVSYPHDLMMKLWNWYHHNDHFIRSVRTFLFKYIFDGEFNVEFPRNIPYYEMKANSSSEWKNFMSDAFDWINIFGFVPWYYAMSPQRRLFPVTPAFGTGEFVLYRKKNTREYQIGWVENDLKRRIERSVGFHHQQNISNFIRRIEDSGFRVSWTHQTRPKSCFPVFTSDLSTIFEKYLDVEEVRTNLLVADYNSSHPYSLNFINEKPKTTSEISEADMLRDTGELDIDLINQSRYTIMKKEFSKQQKAVEANDMTSVRMLTGPQGENTQTYIDRKHIDFDIAPMGITSGVTQNFNVIARYSDLKKLYEEAVSSIFGLKRTQVSGEYTFTSNKIESKTSQTDLETTMSHFRTMLNEVANDVYNKTFLNYDKKLVGFFIVKKSGNEEMKKIIEKIRRKGGLENVVSPVKLVVNFGEQLTKQELKLSELTGLFNVGVLDLKEIRSILIDNFNFGIDEKPPKELLLLEKESWSSQEDTNEGTKKTSGSSMKNSSSKSTSPSFQTKKKVGKNSKRKQKKTKFQKETQYGEGSGDDEDEMDEE